MPIGLPDKCLPLLLEGTEAWHSRAREILGDGVSVDTAHERVPEELFSWRPELVQFLALLRGKGAKEDAGHQEERAVRQVVRCVDDAFLALWIQGPEKLSSLVDERLGSFHGNRSRKVRFEWFSDPFPVLPTDQPDAGSQQFAEKPSRVVVGGFDMQVRVPAKRLHVPVWIGHWKFRYEQRCYILFVRNSGGLTSRA